MKNSLRFTFKIAFISILAGFIGAYLFISLYQKNQIHHIKAPQNAEKPKTKQTYVVEKSDLKTGIKKAIETAVEINVNTVGFDFFNQKIQGQNKGSGVVISSDGYIITNDHVVNKGQEINVKLHNGEIKRAKIIGKDPKSDLALLKVDAKDLPYAEFDDSDNYEVGDNVIVIGNPLGSGTTVTTGIISAKERVVSIGNETFNLIQTNAAVNKGNSGGGMFGINGKLIGIINSKASGIGIEGVGYAIPANQVSDIYSELKEFGHVKSRATLGVGVTEIKDNFYLEDGLYVSKVLDDSSAQKAGIQKGDRIVAINDQKIENYQNLSYELKKYKVGETIKVDINRKGEKHTLNVKLYPNSETNDKE